MREVIDRALDRSDVVITGGGLGPTQDDVTREVIAEATGRRLILDQRLVEQIDRRFRRRGLIMTPNNQRQAYIPEGATVVDNPNGTAPSFFVEDSRAVVFALPGVPFELKWLFDNELAPYLRRRFELSETIAYRVLKVADMGESSVDDLIGHLIVRSTNPTVGVLAHPGQVDVRIAAKASTVEEAMALIGPTEDEVRALLGGHLFAVDGETMEGVVGGLLDARGATIAVYEDLTGGMVAGRLNEASESRFVEGVVANGESTVRRLLGSAPPPGDAAALAKELARSVRALAGSTLGLAVHVVPGEEEVENLGRGEAYICVTDGAGYRSREYPYGGRGRPDRTRMSLNAIEQVRAALLDGFEG
jgi:nicotinamide-nucleotide amidase